MLKNGLFLGFMILVGLIAACEKPEVYDENAQYVIDEAIIKKWADSTKTELTKHPSGLYYLIIRPGIGTEIVSTYDTLTVNHTTKIFKKDSVISSATDTTGYKFILETGIPGWKNGLPLIKQGGRIRLIIPSNQAYKNYVIGNIPKNTILDCTIDLRKVVKDRLK